MSFELVINQPPETGASGTQDLFNTAEFYKLYQTKDTFFISLYYGRAEDDQKKLLAVCNFVLDGEHEAISPRRGPYGGINFLDEVDAESVHGAVEAVLNYLTGRGIKKISITEPPFAHNTHLSSILLNAYLQHGFVVKNQEINHTLEACERPLVDLMKYNNRKRLKKCLNKPLVFSNPDSTEEFEEIYRTIEINRNAKGYKISMTYDQIMDLFNAVPENIYFFKSTLDGIVVAASICVKINPKVLYVFYWGDLPGYEDLSPVVHLASGIYDFAQSNGFELIDAGTSSLKGVPNFGVAKFKENLGFKASPKLTYCYNHE